MNKLTKMLLMIGVALVLGTLADYQGWNKLVKYTLMVAGICLTQYWCDRKKRIS